MIVDLLAGGLVFVAVVLIGRGMAVELRLLHGKPDLQREIWEREYDLGMRDDPPPVWPRFGAGELIQIEGDFSRVSGIDLIGTWAAAPGPAPVAGRVVWRRGDEIALDCGGGRAAFADVSDLRPLN